MTGCSQIEDQVMLILEMWSVSNRQQGLNHLRKEAMLLTVCAELPREPPAPPLGIWLTCDPFRRGVRPSGLIPLSNL